MPRSYVFIFVALFVCARQGYAQGQNNFWAFGINCGFDFSSGSPVLVRTKSQTSEGCATVCSANGALLFYSDGNHVWDRNGDLMPHGSGLLGNTGGWATSYGSSTQGVTIMPFIDDTNRYYIFTTDCMETISTFDNGYLRYNLVDMRLNNGLGDVDSAYKNIIMADHMGEKAYPVAGARCYNWLITHRYESNEFLAFKVGVSGLDTTPVSSVTGTVVVQEPRSYVFGELKASPDTKLLATASNPWCIDIFDFDNSTGRVSNARRLDSVFAYGYGINFSPLGSKLYVDGHNGRIRQYDMSLMPDIDAVHNSATAIGDSGAHGAIRTGPDHKMYTPRINENIMYYINDPESKGVACNIAMLNLPPTTADMHFQSGLGNPVVVNHPIVSSFVDTLVCLGTELTFSGPQGYPSYLWDNGDTSQTRTFDDNSMAWVNARGRCPEETDTFRIQMQDCNCTVSIPTAFSPNGDSKNDRFKIITGDLSSFHMEVYNRYGQPVFYTSTIGRSWDGTFKGELCETGTYYYYVKLKCIQGENVFRKGDVTLIR